MKDDYHTPKCLEVRIKSSKTDPFRKGVSIFLGVTGEALCPVAANLSYMVARGKVAGPFFVFGDGRLLTRDRFVSAVRRALTAAGMDCPFTQGTVFGLGQQRRLLVWGFRTP